MTEQKNMFTDGATPVPSGFGFENEHPILTMPFTVRIGPQIFEGQRLSVAEMEVSADGQSVPAGARGLATVKFPFQDFAITLTAKVSAPQGGTGGDTIRLLFSEPTGPHLPQLRYIMNSFIAGDLISLQGMMAYTGPTQPKAIKAAQPKTMKERVRSIGVAVLSGALALVAATAVYTRYTTAYELHPVFVERAGHSMQATVSGQLTYLAPDAAPGEVIFSVASNTGDVLSFQKPETGEVTISPEIFEGATVLPEDLILTISDVNDLLRLRTLISIEGLSRAMRGDPARIELNDGRVYPVDVVVRQSTRSAALSGDLYVPVDLAVRGKGLDPSDVGKSARLRLSKTLTGVFGFGQENGQ